MENDMNTKERITELLLSTQRDGMDAMIEYLNTSGFFESPASTKFHGAYPGGLADHSLRVFEILGPYVDLARLITHPDTTAGKKPLPLCCDSVVIATLLHDICKAGAYVGDEAPYKWNKTQPGGHALLSIERIKKYIKLEPIEELMIRFHMGLYGLNEFYEEGSWESKNAEYPVGTIGDFILDVFGGPEYAMRGDHSKDEGMSKEESQKARGITTR
jgi:hypothetical protein